MDQIVDRVRLIISILDEGKSLGNESFDYEVVALNFRKILELIAYASLSGHVKEYKAAHKKAEKHHRAKDILDEIEKLNIYFYPKPVTLEPGSGNKDNPHHIKPREDDFLTRNEFITLYDKCSEVIHVRNVLRDDQQIDFLHPPKVWLKKITNLLDRHTIVFANDDSRWLIIMLGDSKKAHVYDLGVAE